MGKSIYGQLVDGQIDVDHHGETLNHVALPLWLQDIGMVLNKELLPADENKEVIEILTDKGILTGFISIGVQQAIVAVRAVTRPADIAGTLKGEKIEVSIINDEINARERATNYLPPVLRRPERELTIDEQRQQALKTLLDSGMSIEDITAMAK